MADNDVLELDDGEGRGMNGASRHRSRSPVRKSRSRSRSPREWRRGERNRSHDRDRGQRRSVREDHRGKVRLYVCNMPYDVNWQFLKDLFKKEIGTAITYVEMYSSPDGKSCGAGVVEIKGKDMAELAIEKFDRFEMKGRKIVVREEREKDRIRHMGSDSNRDMGDMRGGNNMGGMGGGNYGGNMGGGMNMGGQNMMGGGGGGNVHGISPSVIQQLNIDPKIVTNQVFIANLDYKVTSKKLREVFKMAGTVVDVDLKEDQDGKSRGMAVVKYEHPVEAVQAISMFNQQMLFERAMTVKMDKLGDSSYAPQQIPNKLPSGLQGIGMGLGSGGAPVNIQQFGNMNNMMPPSNQNMMGGNMGGMNTMAAAPMNTGMTSNMSMPTMNPMSTPTTMNTMMTGMPGMSTNMQSQGMGMSAPMPAMNMGDMSMTSPMGSMGGGMAGDMGMTNTMQTMSSTMTSPMGGGMDRASYGGSPNMGAPIPSRTGGNMGSGGNGMGMEQTSVFVRNLPFSMNWQDLKQRFTQCGDVKYAEIKMDNGRSKGFGTVKFHTEADAQRAINMFNGTRIDGRTIEVRLNRI